MPFQQVGHSFRLAPDALSPSHCIAHPLSSPPQFGLLGISCASAAVALYEGTNIISPLLLNALLTPLTPSLAC